MQITLRQLEIFRAIAVEGGTAAAALSVPLSQSATSTALSELERGLQTRFFDRVGKRLVLNDSGRALLPLALGVLDGARHIETAFSSHNHSRVIDLHLFASTTIGNYVLPRLLAEVRSSMPTARLEVRIGNTLEAVTAVCNFSADLGMIEGPCHVVDVVVIPWFDDDLVIIAAPTHPLARAARRAKLTFAQLRDAPWLMREPGSGTREVVELSLQPHLGNLQPTLILGSSESIKNAAAQQLGVSCLSRSVVEDLVSAKRLAILNTRLPKLSRSFALIHHRNKTLSDPLARFIQHCQRVPLPPREITYVAKGRSRVRGTF